jgi:hypothetical protein
MMFLTAMMTARWRLVFAMLIMPTRPPDKLPGKSRNKHKIHVKLYIPVKGESRFSLNLLYL